MMMLAVLSLSAQESRADSTSSNKDERKLPIFMYVKDHITHDGIDSTLTAVLLNAADSSFVDSIYAYSSMDDGKRNSYISLVVDKPGSYLIRVNADEYATKYVPLQIKKLYKHENYRQLKPIYLHKLPKKNEYALDEVVVKATKLKFYMDGDTLVYDADAFNLAEGSMLDGLIKRLPGVELKKSGEITVNGRRVDALLLNGKDFFDKDREIILENMPAYMVKNIQAYERVDPKIKGTPKEKTTKKEFIMNVRLKKEYNAGWITNAEGGAGPTFFRNSDGKLDTKYLGRIFALHYDDKSRFTMYANVNNLTDDRKPGEEGDWSPLTQSTGLMQTAKLGANYLRGDYEEGRYEGSASIAYSDKDNAHHTARETFLEGGNTFGRSLYNMRSYEFKVQSDHRFYKSIQDLSWAKNFNIQGSPSFGYSKYNNQENSASATFAEDVASGLGKAWMDSISNPASGKMLRKYAINRTLSSRKAVGHWINVTPNLNLSMTPLHNDYINLSLGLQYEFTDRKDDDYEHYHLNSYKADTDDFQNRYNPTFDRTHDFAVNPSFSYTLDNEHRHRISIGNTYRYENEKHRNSLYLLNKLEQWGDSTKHSIGTLPSTEEMLRTLDADNSTRTGSLSHSNRPTISYHYSLSTEKYYYYLDFRADLPIKREKLEYWQGSQVDTTFWRTTVFFNPQINFYRDEHKRGRSIMAAIYMSASAPSMTGLLNITNTADPLYVTKSNPNLKNSYEYYVYGQYRDKFGRTLFNSNINLRLEQNAIASGYIYNRETGVRIMTPENVNGNWRANASSGIDFPLFKEDKWRIKDNISYFYNHSVDLNGTNESLVATRSVVKTHNVEDELSITYRPNDKYEFGAKGKLDYQNSTSERKDFEPINALDFNYGLTAVMELPWNMQVATDVTMYSRRGYSDRNMNTNELVWNARISKRCMKGNLSIMFDAFDLLGNLSNVHRYINAQGKSEIFYNVIPSYGLLHVIYRWNKKPKNKQ